ncbi:phosphotransferase [Brevibacillus humidisoli]|uniref:phosphotransferase n=1 Tax=Brevibacillus humidisoli TaxID=2895522 RepID=UPI001E586BF2|nr:phosphotransferase [Brevibacillus humidisoli]UFJ39069.1 phosphotransferase [Brevibacillus humidisoli]
MARERIQLSYICQRYKIRVIDVKARGDHYLLETNRGPKELHIWPRLDVLRWSFAWREQLARQGFREVERFIRTRDAKPYVVVRKTGFTLNDHLRDVETFSPTSEQANQCGQIAARMHQAQAMSEYPQVVDLLRREQSHAESEVKRARELYQQLKQSPKGLGQSFRWVVQQFPALLERMDRSVELLHSPLLNEELLAASHLSLGPENWAWLDGKLFLHGFYRSTLSVQPRDMSLYLQYLYQQDETFERVDAFLDGYEQIKPLRYEEYLLMLAFLAFPAPTWKQVEQFVTDGQESDEEAVGNIRQTLQKQQDLDHLLLHLARRSERLGRGIANEPI